MTPTGTKLAAILGAAATLGILLAVNGSSAAAGTGSAPSCPAVRGRIVGAPAAVCRHPLTVIRTGPGGPAAPAGPRVLPCRAMAGAVSNVDFPCPVGPVPPASQPCPNIPAPPQAGLATICSVGPLPAPGVPGPPILPAPPGMAPCPPPPGIEAPPAAHACPAYPPPPPQAVSG